jgi:hypothetical protein
VPAAEGSSTLVTVAVGWPEDPRDVRREAVRRLPRAYSLALRLRDAGVCDELIAECVEVELEALGTLFELAEAKIAAMRPHRQV